MVAWYFEHRVLAHYETGYTAQQSAANDRLWNYICTHDTPSPADWLAANNAEAPLTYVKTPKPAKIAEAIEQPAEAAAASDLPKSADRKSERSARAAYWRDQKRRKRSSARRGP
jgi:hypothetical protein